MQEGQMFDKPIIDFVTTSVDFCRKVEQCQSVSRQDFTDSMLNLLPVLYFRANQIHLSELSEEGYNEPHVTESDYEFVRNSVASIMKEYDDFLDVFVEDFKYSDQPILQTVSENIADIYQALRDFIEIFRAGYSDAIEIAISDVCNEFNYSWGQKLLNTLRALHCCKYGGTLND